MNAYVGEPLRLVLANDSSIHVRPAQDQSSTHLVVVHVPWPVTSPGDGRAIADLALEDDLANATWEDAEWQ